jgi:single-stranded-DNA-specific exonuclease
VRPAKNTLEETSPPIRIERRAPAAAADHLAADMPTILRQVYLARGACEADDVALPLESLLPFTQLGGVGEAAQLLAAVMQAGGRILVVGDFDADGATSCALSVLALRAMGHRDVDFLVPNRFEYGYGLTPEIVALALQRQPDLIMTVDNGISSLAGVEAANAAGIPVLVTDHHLPGDRLPAAAAIVNPNVAGDPFPSKATAGVGVVFYVLLALRAHLRESGWFGQRGIEAPNMAQFLDIVALGTVADVVPLDRNNRVLVKHGLARIRAGRCRPGILALLEIAGRNHQRVQANDMGFAVGPRLNAAGRLDDMSLGINCLLAEDASLAREYASELDRLNRERRTIEQDMRETAEALLQDWQLAQADLPWGLCLYREDWHQGVIGILASRIRERYHRPVIAFASGDDGMIKGSARSIPGLHIRDALDRVAAQHPELLQKFGGHAMAAGMTIRHEHFEAFSEAFEQVVRERITAHDLQPLIMTDGAIPPQEMTLDTAEAIVQGGPWGQGFVEPLFDDVFEVLSQRIVGERHWKLVLQHPDGSPGLDAIAFNAVEDHPQLPPRLHLVYHLDINEWRGQLTLQLRVHHMEPA